MRASAPAALSIAAFMCGSNLTLVATRRAALTPFLAAFVTNIFPGLVDTLAHTVYLSRGI